MNDHRSLLEPGTVLDGKYRIDRVIGLGGFGITYAAYDLGLATGVAIKEYYPTQFAMRDTTLSVRAASGHDRPLFERLRSSFLREARTLAQFDHPTIVRVRNVFEGHGTAYMVMQLENGPSFKRWLAELERKPTSSEIEAIAFDLLEGLEVMHAATFLHRDIAPDNIIIRSDGRPVILDFGASRRVLTGTSGAMTGIVKPGYSPQEQYSSDGRTQGPWTDIYALGATLYRAVTDTAPVDATARMLDVEMPSASALAAGEYRPSFLEAIDWAMQLRPIDRPQTIAAWRARMFGGAAKAKPDAAKTRSARLSASERKPRPEAPVLPAAHVETAANPPERTRRSGLATIGGTAALALIGATAGAMMLYAGIRFFSAPLPEVSSAVRTQDGKPRNQQADRVAAEQAARKQRDDAERQAREDTARKAKEQADRLAAETSARKQADDAARVDKQSQPTTAPTTLERQHLVVAKIRTELNRVGCLTPATSPGWTGDDQKALERFVRLAGAPLSFTELNYEIAEAVGTYVGRVCPLECAAGETAAANGCVPPGTAAQAKPVLCNQINERAQLGVLTEDDREQLRTGRCR